MGAVSERSLFEDRNWLFGAEAVFLAQPSHDCAHIDRQSGQQSRTRQRLEGKRFRRILCLILLVVLSVGSLSVVTLATPNPDITKVVIDDVELHSGFNRTVTLDKEPGESFDLYITVKNYGTSSPTPYNGITASFEDFTSSSDKSRVELISQATSPDLTYGEYFGSDNGGGPNDYYDYVLVEASRNVAWGSNVVRRLSLRVTPTTDDLEGGFNIYIRAAMSGQQSWEYGWERDPGSTAYEDCTGIDAYRIQVQYSGGDDGGGTATPDPDIEWIKIDGDKQETLNSTVSLNIEPGDSFDIQVQAQNNGDPSPSPFNGITLSFPSFESSSDKSRVEMRKIGTDRDLEDTYGEYFGNDNGGGPDDYYDYVLCESTLDPDRKDSWGNRKDYKLKIRVTPPESAFGGDFIIYYRAGMSGQESWNSGWEYDPSSGSYTDCTGKKVYRIVVKLPDIINVPDPSIPRVEVDGNVYSHGSIIEIDIKPGESFRFAVTGKNSGDSSPSHYNGITMSFPSLEAASLKSAITLNKGGTSNQLESLFGIYFGNDNGGGPDEYYDYVLAEAQLDQSWGKNKSYELDINITPPAEAFGKDFVIYYRVGMSGESSWDSGWEYDPSSSSYTDCTGKYVQRVVIRLPASGFSPEAVPGFVTLVPEESALYPVVQYGIACEFSDDDGWDDIEVCYLRIEHPTKTQLLAWYPQTQVSEVQNAQGVARYVSVHRVDEHVQDDGKTLVLWWVSFLGTWPATSAGDVRFAFQALDKSGRVSGEWIPLAKELSFSSGGTPLNMMFYDSIEVELDDGAKVFQPDGWNPYFPGYDKRVKNYKASLYDALFNLGNPAPDKLFVSARNIYGDLSETISGPLSIIEDMVDVGQFAAWGAEIHKVADATSAAASDPGIASHVFSQTLSKAIQTTNAWAKTGKAMYTLGLVLKSLDVASDAGEILFRTLFINAITLDLAVNVAQEAAQSLSNSGDPALSAAANAIAADLWNLAQSKEYFQSLSDQFWANSDRFLKQGMGILATVGTHAFMKAVTASAVATTGTAAAGLGLAATAGVLIAVDVALALDLWEQFDRHKLIICLDTAGNGLLLRPDSDLSDGEKLLGLAIQRRMYDESVDLYESMTFLIADFIWDILGINKGITESTEFVRGRAADALELQKQFIVSLEVPDLTRVIVPSTPQSLEPEGSISGLEPDFSWTPYEHGGDGETQAGYRLQVFGTNAINSELRGSLIYDTDLVEDTSANTHTYDPVKYSGQPLQWNHKYVWKVRYQDSGGDWSAWSEETLFTPTKDDTPPQLSYPKSPGRSEDTRNPADDITTNSKVKFKVHYYDAEGDLPDTATVVIKAPSGATFTDGLQPIWTLESGSTYSAFLESKDSRSFSEEGTYSYHFEVTQGEHEVRFLDGSEFYFKVDPYVEEHPPTKPLSPQPSPYADDVAVDTTLTWNECTDADGDTVAYYVEFGTNPSHRLNPRYDTDTPEFDPAKALSKDLEYETTYYWRVFATAGSDETAGDPWEFTTGEEGGEKDNPTPPVNPEPRSGAKDVSLRPTLCWDRSTDPNGDQIEYYVYFGTNSDVRRNTLHPDRRYPGSQDTCLDPNAPLPVGIAALGPSLEPNTTYYWQVLATDGDNDTHGDRWSFTTGAGGSVPPVLRDPEVRPARDVTAGTPMQVFVRYSDEDRDLPTMAELEIYTGGAHIMISPLPTYKTVPMTNTFGVPWDGVYSTEPFTLEAGNYRARLVFSDGTHEVTLPETDFLEFQITGNSCPQVGEILMDVAGEVIEVGDSLVATISDYTFYVNYRDLDGDAPIRALFFLDGRPLDTFLKDGDRADGEYAHALSGLESGLHEIYFEFDDGNCGDVVRTDVSVIDVPDIPIPPTPPVDARLVAHYPLEGNANDVIGSRNGTLMGAPKSVTGVDGQGYEFDNAPANKSYIRTSGSYEPGTNPFAVSLWFQTSDTVTGADRILSTHSTANWYAPNYAIFLLADGRVMFRTNDARWNHRQDVRSGTTGLTDGAWHHVVVQRQANGDLQVWLDGELDASANYPVQNIQNGGNPLGIGGGAYNNWSSGYSYKGAIDDVRIYEGALTQTEIENLFGSVTPPTPGPGPDPGPGIGEITLPFNDGFNTAIDTDVWAYVHPPSHKASISDGQLFIDASSDVTQGSGVATNGTFAGNTTVEFDVKVTYLSCMNNGQNIAKFGDGVLDDTYHRPGGPNWLFLYANCDGNLYAKTSNGQNISLGQYSTATKHIKIQFSTSETWITLDGNSTTVPFVLDDYHIWFGGHVHDAYYDALSVVAGTTEPAPPTPPGPTSATLVAHYPLNGNANDAAGSRNGTFVGGSTPITGVDGQGYEFDNDPGNKTYIKTSGSYEPGTNPFAVSLWFQTSDAVTGADRILSTHSTANWYAPNYAIFLLADGRVMFRTNDATSNHRQDVHSLTTNVIDGAWHHVVVQRQANGDLQVWLDGELDASANYPVQDIRNGGNPLGIGGGAYNNWSSGYSYKGAIDDVRIYEGALTQTEIENLFGSVTPPTPGPGPDPGPSTGEIALPFSDGFNTAIDTDVWAYVHPPNHKATISDGQLFIDASSDVTQGSGVATYGTFAGNTTVEFDVKVTYLSCMNNGQNIAKFGDGVLDDTYHRPGGPNWLFLYANCDGNLYAKTSNGQNISLGPHSSTAKRMKIQFSTSETWITYDGVSTTVPFVLDDYHIWFGGHVHDAYYDSLSVVAGTTEPAPPTPPTPPGPTSATLVAHYPLNGNANDAAGSRNGTLIGGPTPITGVDGQGYEFDNDPGNKTYITTTGSYEPGTNPFAVSLWFQTNDPAVTGADRIMSTHSTANWYAPNYAIFLLADGRVMFRTNDASANHRQDVHSLTTDLIDGAWHHVVVQRQANGDLQLWLDGELDASANYPVQDIRNGGNPLGIGGGAYNNWSSGYSYKGAIDDVRIYEGALTQTEIENLFGSVTPPAPTPPAPEGLPFTDTFDTAIDTDVWAYVHPPSHRASISGGELFIDASGDATQGCGVATKRTFPNDSTVEFDIRVTEVLCWNGGQIVTQFRDGVLDDTYHRPIGPNFFSLYASCDGNLYVRTSAGHDVSVGLHTATAKHLKIEFGPTEAVVVYGATQVTIPFTISDYHIWFGGHIHDAFYDNLQVNAGTVTANSIRHDPGVGTPIAPLAYLGIQGKPMSFVPSQGLEVIVKTRVLVYDLSGTQVFESGWMSGERVDWTPSGLARGFYIAVVQSVDEAGSTRSERRKVVVQ